MDYKNETITDIIIETIEIKDKEENILGHAYKYNSGMLMIAMNKGNVILSREYSISSSLSPCQHPIQNICSIAEEAPKISEFKDTKDKPRLGYVYRSFLNAVTAVREFGAKKYQNHNTWRQVPMDDYYHALMRHVSAMMDARFNPESRETLIDAESGIRHAAHAACDLMYIIEEEDSIS